MSAKDDLTTIEGFIKFLRRREPHSMITVSTVADVLESILVPPKELNRYEAVSDEVNRHENISDYVKEKGLCLSDSPSETNTSDWSDTIPRTVKCITCGKEVVYYCGFYIGTSDEDKVGPFCSKCMDDELKS